VEGGRVEELPKVKFFLIRHFPSIEDPNRPTVFELVRSVVEDLVFDNVWRGRAEVKLYPSRFEELDALSPVEVLGGHLFSMGMTIKGGLVLEKLHTHVLNP